MVTPKEQLNYVNISTRIVSCIEQIKNYRQKEQINPLFIEDINKPLENLYKDLERDNLNLLWRDKDGISIGEYLTCLFGEIPIAINKEKLEEVKDKQEELEKTISTLKKVSNNEYVPPKDLNNTDELLKNMINNYKKEIQNKAVN